MAYSLADAEKAYVEKNWPLAISAYQEVCPLLAQEKQNSCFYWYVLALSQSGKASDFTKAGKTLDSLLKNMSAQDVLYSDFLMTKAQFEIYLKKYDNARTSLEQAKETSKKENNPLLIRVCRMLFNKDKSEKTEILCNSMEEQKDYVSLVADTTSKGKDTLLPVTSKNDSLVKSVKTESESFYTIQVGAFSKKENAEALKLALKSRKIETTIEERISDSRILYLVQSGSFSTKEMAETFAEENFLPLQMEWTVIKITE